MTCPHIVIKAGKKVCKRMIEDGLNGAVSDFDVNHYCKGNPIHCYYFRTAPKQKLLDWRASRRKKVEVPATVT